MEKYLINNKTIALYKKNRKTFIYNVDNILVFNKNLIKIIEENCIYYGSSLDGRKKVAKSILNLNYKLPIIIDEKNNLTLLQLNSIRNKNCLYIVTNKIVDYEQYNKFLKIVCVNNIVFYVNISINSFEKLLIKSIKLNNILFWRKNSNSL